jgi:hypothetical protein
VSIAPISLNQPSFGAVYQLMTQKDGFLRPFTVEDDQTVPYRLGQYLHPGTTTGSHHELVWQSPELPSGKRLFIDGQELEQVKELQHQVHVAQNLGDIDMVEQAGMKLDSGLISLAQQAYYLDVTAMHAQPERFAVDPDPNAKPESGQPMPQTDDAQAAPATTAKAAPEAAYYHPDLVQQAQPTAKPAPASPADAPQPMAYSLQPPGPLDPASFEATMKDQVA